MFATYRRFNQWLAAKITNAVATMTCAYAFAVLACVSLPDAIRGGSATLVAWIAQTFLQLVLLSVIMVGQNLQQQKQDEHSTSLDELHNKHDALHDHIKGSKP